MTVPQKEDLRHAVLEVLANREGSALTARQICRRAADEVDFKITDEDVEIVLMFLLGLNLVDFSTDGLGSTKYWKITSAGVLAFERGAIPPPPKTRE